jgi:hypothetical protein
MVAFGLLMVAVGLAWLGQIQLGDDYLHLLFPMLVLATGMGLTMAPATESIMGSLPRSKAGVGSAMNDTTRQVGGALGVAVIGSVLASAYRPNIAKSMASTSLGRAAQLPGAAGDQARVALSAIHDQVGAAGTVVQEAAKNGHPLPDANAILHNAHAAFLSGFGNALLLGAFVALVGSVLVLIFLPAHGVDADTEDPVVGEPEPLELAEVESVVSVAGTTEASSELLDAVHERDRLPASAGSGPSDVS